MLNINPSPGVRKALYALTAIGTPVVVYLQAKGYRFPAAWASPPWRKAFPKPRGLPVTVLRGRDGRVVLAEKGQMFAEDVQAIADLI